MTVLASRGQLRASVIRWSLFSVPALMLLGLIASRLGGPDSLWFEALVKPGQYPGPQWFGMVWIALLGLAGFALALVCAAWGARGRSAALWAFVGHVLLALAWPLVFFGGFQLTIGLVLMVAGVLLLLVVIALFWRVRALAGALLLPYLLWACCTAFLGYEFLRLNPDADGQDPTRAVQRIEI